MGVFDLAELSLSYIQYLVLVLSTRPSPYPEFFTSPLLILNAINLDITEAIDEIKDPLFQSDIRSAIPASIPLDIRFSFLLVAVLAPMFYSTVSLLFLAPKVFIVWFLFVLTSVFMVLSGALFSLLPDELIALTKPVEFFNGLIIIGSIILCLCFLYGMYWLFTSAIRKRKSDGKYQIQWQEPISKHLTVEEVLGYEVKDVDYIGQILRVIYFAVAFTIGLACFEVYEISFMPFWSRLGYTSLALGIVFMIVAAAGVFFFGLSSFRWGREELWKLSNGLQNVLLSLTILVVTLLFVPVGTNIVSILNCAESSCPANYRLPDSVDSLVEYYTINSARSNNYKVSSSFVSDPAAEYFCQPVDLVYNSSATSVTSCPSDAFSSSSRIFTDRSVKCTSELKSYLIPAATIVLITFILGLAYLQFVLTKAATHAIESEFPLDARQAIGLDFEQLMEEKLTLSDNVAKLVYAPFRREFRYWRMLALLHRFLLIVAAGIYYGTNENDDSISSAALSLTLLLVFNILYTGAFIFSRPYARRVENSVAIGTQTMLTIVNAVGLGSATNSNTLAPEAFNITVAVFVFVVPIACLIGGGLWTKWDFDEKSKLRSRRIAKAIEKAIDEGEAENRKTAALKRDGNDNENDDNDDDNFAIAGVTREAVTDDEVGRPLSRQIADMWRQSFSNNNNDKNNNDPPPGTNTTTTRNPLAGKTNNRNNNDGGIIFDEQDGVQMQESVNFDSDEDEDEDKDNNSLKKDQDNSDSDANFLARLIMNNKPKVPQHLSPRIVKASSSFDDDEKKSRNKNVKKNERAPTPPFLSATGKPLGSFIINKASPSRNHHQNKKNSSTTNQHQNESSSGVLSNQSLTGLSPISKQNQSKSSVSASSPNNNNDNNNNNLSYNDVLMEDLSSQVFDSPQEELHAIRSHGTFAGFNDDEQNNNEQNKDNNNNENDEPPQMMIMQVTAPPPNENENEDDETVAVTRTNKNHQTGLLPIQRANIRGHRLPKNDNNSSNSHHHLSPNPSSNRNNNAKSPSPSSHSGVFSIENDVDDDDRSLNHNKPSTSVMERKSPLDLVSGFRRTFWERRAQTAERLIKFKTDFLEREKEKEEKERAEKEKVANNNNNNNTDDTSSGQGVSLSEIFSFAINNDSDDDNDDIFDFEVETEQEKLDRLKRERKQRMQALWFYAINQTIDDLIVASIDFYLNDREKELEQQINDVKEGNDNSESKDSSSGTKPTPVVANRRPPPPAAPPSKKPPTNNTVTVVPDNNNNNNNNNNKNNLPTVVAPTQNKTPATGRKVPDVNVDLQTSESSNMSNGEIVFRPLENHPSVVIRRRVNNNNRVKAGGGSKNNDSNAANSEAVLRLQEQGWRRALIGIIATQHNLDAKSRLPPMLQGRHTRELLAVQQALSTPIHTEEDEIRVRNHVKELYEQHLRGVADRQEATDFRVNRETNMTLQIFFTVVGLFSFVALTLTAIGLQVTQRGDRTTFLPPNGLQNSTAEFQYAFQDEPIQGRALSLAGYSNWTSFVDNCCCSAFANQTFSNAKTVEKWLCPGGTVKERLRETASVSSLASVRPLCGRSFLNGCEVVVDSVSPFYVRLLNCNEIATTSEERDLW